MTYLVWKKLKYLNEPVSYLIVTSDDNDTDTSSTAILYRVKHFSPRRIQHTNTANKGHVSLERNIKTLIETKDISNKLKVSKLNRLIAAEADTEPH